MTKAMILMSRRISPVKKAGLTFYHHPDLTKQIT